MALAAPWRTSTWSFSKPPDTGSGSKRPGSVPGFATACTSAIFPSKKNDGDMFCAEKKGSGILRPCQISSQILTSKVRIKEDDGRCQLTCNYLTYPLISHAPNWAGLQKGEVFQLWASDFQLQGGPHHWKPQNFEVSMSQQKNCKPARLREMWFLVDTKQLVFKWQPSCGPAGDHGVDKAFIHWQLDLDGDLLLWRSTIIEIHVVHTLRWWEPPDKLPQKGSKTTPWLKVAAWIARRIANPTTLCREPQLTHGDTGFLKLRLQAAGGQPYCHSQ